MVPKIELMIEKVVNPDKRAEARSHTQRQD